MHTDDVNNVKQHKHRLGLKKGKNAIFQKIKN